MPKAAQLIGKRFTRLLVMARHGSQKSGNSVNATWLCRCDCGAQLIATTNNLTRRGTESCGCLQKERARKPRGVAGFNDLYASYKAAAAKRNYAFLLSKEDFKKLTESVCYYCGAPPAAVHVAHHDRSKESIQHESYVFNGVDRVENSLGYTPENSVACCKFCNISKRERSIPEFSEWAKRLVENLSKRGI